MNISIRQLQTKVNQIAEELGGLETNEKLEKAKEVARQDSQVSELLLEILDEALTKRWNRDMRASIEQFLS